ncbi:protein takeout-like isoform X3 [Ostrinia furnacalis]|uniref:protein takeout-like isoform X1 n=1 Tax=Ostrinia furnacalis TaxID=93504 RepID=UPI0010393C95|nr:protein takeout-like isoform X1 [Ostrinia furnacalis]XP_028177883.1 protein takeout-like isoform X3 [Ostrinia furnacalis]
MVFKELVLSFCVLLTSVRSSLAPFIEACHESDSQCNLRSATNALPSIAGGVPALGISALDPMHLGRVRTNNAGLSMEFRDTTIKGLKNSQITKIVRHGRHLQLELKCSLEMRGDYTMSGRLLVMPIEGDGKYRIKIRDMVVDLKIDFSERRAGGDTFWSVQHWNQTSRVETGASFRFQNLFKGNKKLSDGIHEFANNNWREIFSEVAPPMVQKTVGQIVQEVAKLFSKVPLKDLIKN